MSLRLVVDNSGDPAAQASPKSCAKVLDRYWLRAAAPEIWARFLREGFASPEAVAVHFEVRFSTACNWWNGLNRPSADKVLIAMVEMPDALTVALAAELDARRAA
ncbi:hypothetical protein ACFSDD_17575 [Salipiger marinus]|uniref:hypothetical protein n=1 Tax=Salipiger marinus TaxID=555512 RepID=UPI002C02FDC3|nr:hypothetical protein [Salipiger manganoxidans]MEB3421750.1 hypothetical protein [Salipiger manganoxidans]